MFGAGLNGKVHLRTRRVVPSDGAHLSNHIQGHNSHGQQGQDVHHSSSFARESVGELLGEIDKVEQLFQPKSVPSPPVSPAHGLAPLHGTIGDIDALLKEIDDMEENVEEKLHKPSAVESKMDLHAGGKQTEVNHHCDEEDKEIKYVSSVRDASATHGKDESGAAARHVELIVSESEISAKSSRIRRNSNRISVVNEGAPVEIESSAAANVSMIVSPQTTQKEQTTTPFEAASVQPNHGTSTITEVEEAHLKKQLEERFKVLMSQIVEFHVRLSRFASKLSDQEVMRADLEEAVETLERDNVLLRKQLSSRDNNIGKLTEASSKLFERHDLHREAMLFEETPEGFALKFETGSDKRKAAGFGSQSIDASLYGMLPFADDVRKIQSRFGTAVAAYFEFYRFMFAQFSLVAAVCLALCVLHLVRNVTSKSMSSKGILPGFMKFSSFSSQENLAYSSIIVSGSIVFAISLFLQVIYKDKLSKELDAIESMNETKYSKLVLCSWDFSLLTKRQRDDFSGTLVQELRQKLSDTKVGKIVKTRTNYELTVLIGKRVFAFFLYICLQLGAMALILYITVSGTSLKDNVSGVSFLRVLAPVFSAIALSVINSSVPFVLKLITAFETWDNPTLQLNILLFRMYFTNTFNVLILAGSYALLADPMLLASNSYQYYRRQVEIRFSTSLHYCRMDQVAEGLFSLLLTAFGLKLLMIILNPFVDFVYSIVFDTPYEKTEFDIASSIISMLYLATIAMLLFPFAPIGIIVVPPMLYILMKWEKFIMLNLYMPPKRPWKAQKAGQVFSNFYLVSFFLVGLPSSIFFFTISTFPKSCEIQDSFVRLCQSDNGLQQNNTCSLLNQRSSFTDLYGDASYCSSGYPSCICDYACGPFIYDSNHIAPFRDAILSIDGLDLVWSALFEYPYGPWALVIIFILLVYFLLNSIRVQKRVYALKELSTKAKIGALEASNKEKEKRLQKIKVYQTRIRDSFIGVDSPAKQLFFS